MPTGLYLVLKSLSFNLPQKSLTVIPIYNDTIYSVPSMMLYPSMTTFLYYTHQLFILQLLKFEFQVLLSCLDSIHLLALMFKFLLQDIHFSLPVRLNKSVKHCK